MNLSQIPSVIRDTIIDIMDIKIQGATNVAIATLDALKKWAIEHKTDVTRSEFISKFQLFSALLSHARPNEPLSKNAVKYIDSMLKLRYARENSIAKLKEAIVILSTEFLHIIDDAKTNIISKNLKHIKDFDTIFTHCHSSTSEILIIHANKERTRRVITSETRPRLQGRITAKHLVEAGLETTMIVDSAIPSFIKENDLYNIDVVLLGADQITVYGDAINKVGSFGIGLACYYASKPLYIVTPSLKMDMSTLYKPLRIEMREACEVWEDAPKGLKIINPSFDIVPRQFIAGYLTEFGLVRAEDLANRVRREYDWII